MCIHRNGISELRFSSYNYLREYLAEKAMKGNVANNCGFPQMQGKWNKIEFKKNGIKALHT